MMHVDLSQNAEVVEEAEDEAEAEEEEEMPQVEFERMTPKVTEGTCAYGVVFIVVVVPEDVSLPKSAGFLWLPVVPQSASC